MYSSAAEAAWLQACQIAPPHPGAGALCMTPARERCVPYFANLALSAALPALLPCAAAYLDWYVGHLQPDGSMADWFFDAQGVLRRARPDSVDAYAATFLSLAWHYTRLAGPVWARANLPALCRVTGAIERLRRRSGLTWARRDWPVQFTMDNSEVSRGLFDFADLLAACGEAAEAASLRARAELSRQAVLQRLYDRRRQAFYYARLPLWAHAGPNWTRWVEAAMEQGPLLCGLLGPDDLLARVLYQRLCLAFPRWEEGETGDPFPWLLIGRVAAALDDRARVERLLAHAEAAHILAGHRYWYCGESGHYLQLRRWLTDCARSGPEPP